MAAGCGGGGALAGCWMAWSLGLGNMMSACGATLPTGAGGARERHTSAAGVLAPAERPR